MKFEQVRNITVLGAGIMGHGIAQSFLMGGYPVKLYDIADEPLNIAKAHIAESLELFEKNEMLKEGAATCLCPPGIKHRPEGGGL